MTVQNAHDKFFRDSFGRVHIARNYLEEYLPKPVLDLLDLDTLTLQDGSFIDEEMREHQTDLLYQVQLQGGGTATIYLLFEHKSFPDVLVALQLLRYMVNLWQQQVKEKVPLTPIIPLVIYHGERAWHIATEFSALLDVPEELRPYQPNFRYHLSDFSYLSDETIRGEIWLRVCLSVLRAIFNPRLRHELDDLATLVFRLSSQRTGLEYIRTIMYYLSDATDRVKREDLEEVLLRQGAEGERVMATIAQEYIREGFEQGRINMLQEDVLDLLHIRFEPVGTTVREQITAVTSITILRQLHREAATADSMATFIEKLAALTDRA
jgi:predicted transposase/invertase (TIGR01784 family)